jgi:hypothetical protein
VRVDETKLKQKRVSRLADLIKLIQDEEAKRPKDITPTNEPLSSEEEAPPCTIDSGTAQQA